MQKLQSIKRTLACLLITFLLFTALPVVSFADNRISVSSDARAASNVYSPNYVVTPISGSAFSHSNVNLRYDPSTSSPSQGLLTLNTPLNVIGRTIGDDNYIWYQVRPTAGSYAYKVGFVRSDCLDFIPSGASIDPAIS